MARQPREVLVTRDQKTKLLRRADNADESVSEMVANMITDYADGKTIVPPDRERLIRVRTMIDADVWDRALARSKKERRSLSTAVRERVNQLLG